MDDELFEYFATCPQGFERLLADELKRLRAQSVRPLKGGAAFFGTQMEGYRVCLWSRIASRVLQVVERLDAHSADALYESVEELDWSWLIREGATISVTARGTNKALRNSQFTALKVKDAVCDSLREARGTRPDVSAQRADVPLWVSIHGNKATLSIDYAGESLHRRGYRIPGEQVEAPLKEALAAGMLVWGGWDHVAAPSVRRAAAKHEGAESMAPAPAFVDPACGSGTLVLEAAMIATDRAPGLSRDYWGFEGCADFDADAWDDLLADADERFEAGMENAPQLLGCDIDSQAVGIARGNAKRLGLARVARFACADCNDLAVTMHQMGVELEQPGFVAINPPYGVRLFSHGLEGFYAKLANGLSELPSTWSMTVITPDAQFDTEVGFDAARTQSVYNGAIEATLRSYTLGQGFLEDAKLLTLEGVEVTAKVTSDHALQFAARLRKMAVARRKWARKNNVHAYRIYDADLPDYAVSVDRFDAEDGQTYILVNEYQAPKEIDPQKAARRFKDACAVTKALLQADEEHFFTRVRKQAKGGGQYRKDSHCSNTVTVSEGGHSFELDLSGYLDTGLFLDHRITRGLVQDRAEGKHFLNLFAYTGTASVYAAAGGAAETTTVDMSGTYLDWAQRNMKRNGFAGKAHAFVKADVLSWVEQQAANASAAHYDLIFLDPPTFSNSKTMGERTWDIQRDHAQLLQQVSALLKPGGTIVFSGNLRSFKLDEPAIEAMGLQAQNITAQTIPEDFSRNPKIHFCYLLTK